MITNKNTGTYYKHKNTWDLHRAFYINKERLSKLHDKNLKFPKVKYGLLWRKVTHIWTLELRSSETVFWLVEEFARQKVACDVCFTSKGPVRGSASSPRVREPPLYWPARCTNHTRASPPEARPIITVRPLISLNDFVCCPFKSSSWSF